ncbi:MAG: hypothetical protein JRI23_25295 [Deltaproteobacteria bacterium]|nr:hypothetical protein [Deltaproteobacteria bacterium]MBW2535333.1 hypothetical protein [Deltaproteobacteria bacterium]
MSLSSKALLAVLTGGVLWSCSSWEDETKGTYVPPPPCYTCLDFLNEFIACAPPECPALDELCAGAAADAAGALFECICGSCAAECADICGAGGATAGEITASCKDCGTTAAAACGAEAAACQQN